MNTNNEKINMVFYNTLCKTDKLNILRRMIYAFAERIDKYEVAYIEEKDDGFDCILIQRCPLFDGPHKLHEATFWYNWVKDNINDKSNVIGRHITLASTGNGLVFRKKLLDLSIYY